MFMDLLNEEREIPDDANELISKLNRALIRSRVAVCVRLGRKNEAQIMVSELKEKWPDPKFHKTLDKALIGRIPELP